VAEQEPQRATLRAREGRGLSLRRRALAVRDDGPGWSLLDLEFADPEALADEVTGFGADVLAVEPAEVVAAVVRRLRGAAQAHDAAREGERS
jgi:proteasome accessory factor B